MRTNATTPSENRGAQRLGGEISGSQGNSNDVIMGSGVKIQYETDPTCGVSKLKEGDTQLGGKQIETEM